MTATTNFSYMHSPDKNRCTRTHLAVNIQHMLWQNSHRHPKRKTFTSICPLKHNANGQGWEEHIQTLFSSALSLFSPNLVFSCWKKKKSREVATCVPNQIHGMRVVGSRGPFSKQGSKCLRGEDQYFNDISRKL